MKALGFLVRTRLKLVRFKLPCRYIAFNAVSCGVFDVVYAAVHPEALFPASVMVIGGIFKDAIAPDFVTRSGALVMVTTLACIVGSMLVMVVFRYVKRTLEPGFFACELS